MGDLSSAGIELKRLATLGPNYFKGSIQQPYLTTLIQNLTVSFEDKSIITAFDMFNPASMPSDLTEFLQFGNNDVKKLSEHYHTHGTLDGPQECLTEWSSCRQFLQNSQFKKHSEVIRYLCTDPVMLQMYPNICTMAQVCRVILCRCRENILTIKADNKESYA